ncbi:MULTISPECIES: NO-inducible flavohemoprotein [Shewanella]|uniref:Flavohemoprotein n=1 Tax=Shewanella oncorhynchi TaxID=2726434 RepID=A0AA50Q5I4_9GAMM|nr:NO-inducible flavohemoprotein [Shewanella oncorhynchi]WMB72083.1 NO-inducible flavohemoprotein [Shewanella oncorhynchi]GCF90131.1 flavohemoprotein [Shewanella sp. M-Br]
MLDSRTIQVIKSTIPLLESAGPALTIHFYERMFKHNPELKDVFNLAHQHSGGQPVALFNAVAAYAKNIENLAVLSSTVERIAQKHTGFLIKPEQYAIVGSHLLATLKELGGDAVTEEVLEAWAQAYGFLADMFIQREAQIYQSNAEQDGGWLGERQFIISAKKTESTVITSFILTPEDGKPVKDFIPGQYLSLKLKHPNLAYEEIRQYSLSDAPNGNSYRISVKRELGGQVSNLLHDTMHIGDKIAVMPPAGDFILEVGADIPVVLISAGVGQTPMKSMLNQLIKLQHPSAITWLHACEQGDVHGFKQAIHTKRQQHHNLKSHVWYRKPSSTDVVGTDYDFEGQMELSKVADQLLPHAHYYFCGPIGFMSAIKQQLLALGVSAENMHYEVFGPHADL